MVLYHVTRVKCVTENEGSQGESRGATAGGGVKTMLSASGQKHRIGSDVPDVPDITGSEVWDTKIPPDQGLEQVKRQKQYFETVEV